MVAVMPGLGLDPAPPAAATHTRDIMGADIFTARNYAAAVWDPRDRPSAGCDDGCAYIFGGHKGGPGGYLDDIVRYNPKTDTSKAMVAKLPTPRYCTGAVFDGARYAYLLGGALDGSPYYSNQVVRYDVDNDLIDVPATLPRVKGCAAAAWDGTRAVLFGGDSIGSNGFSETTDEIVWFTPSAGASTRPERLPSPRSAVGAVFDGVGTMYVVGKDQIVKYAPATGSVAVASTKLPWTDSLGVVWVGSRDHDGLLILGGYLSTETSGPTDKIRRWAPASDTLTTYEGTLPTPRYGSAAIWDGLSAFVFGGYIGNGRTKEIVRYNHNHAPAPAIAASPAECQDGRGDVALDAGGTIDAEGDPVTYLWSASGVSFLPEANAAKVTADIPLGSTTVTLTTSDPYLSATTTADASVLDRLAPSTTHALKGTPGNSGYWRSDVTVDYAVADACSAAGATTQSRVDGGPEQQGAQVVVAGDGVHGVTYFSSDAAGNAETPRSTGSVAIDATPPTSRVCGESGTPGKNGWFRSLVDLGLCAEDVPHVSGVESTEFSFDGALFEAGISLTIGADGDHLVKFRSQDRAGNLEAPKAHRVRIDREPPTTAFQLSGTRGNLDWWRSACVSAALLAADTLSGVAQSWYSVDGDAYQPGAAAQVCNDGVHILRGYSEDLAGNVEAAKEVVVRIDSTPPRLQLTQPARGDLHLLGTKVGVDLGSQTVVVGTMTTTQDATDATSGVSHVELLVDGGARGLDAAAPYAIIWRAGDEGLGNHVLTARAWDVAGNNATQDLAVKTVPTTTTGVAATECRFLLSPTACANVPSPPAALGDLCRQVLTEPDCDAFPG